VQQLQQHCAIGLQHEHPIQGRSAQASDGRDKWIDRQIARVAEVGDLDCLLEVIHTLVAQMNALNLATALHRVAKLSASPGSSAKKLEMIKSSPRFVALFTAVKERVSCHSRLKQNNRSVEGSRELPDEMPVHCASIVSWSCAKLRICDEQLLAELATIAVPCLDELDPIQLANMLWAFAKLQVCARDLFSRASNRLKQRKVGEFDTQCLSIIAWSFATVHWRDSAAFASIAGELTRNVCSAKPQEISQTLWAFAKSGYYNRTLFDAFGQAAVAASKHSEFKQQELSNVAWAFATAGIRCTELFAQIERAVLAQQAGMAPQCIANILWAFAKSGVEMQTCMFPALLEAAMVEQDGLKLEELSAVVWAASQVCPHRAEFFGAAQQACVNQLSKFTANAVVNLASSFSSVQTDSPLLYIAIVRETIGRLPQLGARALCNLLRGLSAAKMCVAYASVADDISNASLNVCQHIASRIRDLQPTDIPLLHCALLELSSDLGTKAAGILRTALNQRMSCMWLLPSVSHEAADGHSVASLSTTDSGSDCSAWDDAISIATHDMSEDDELISTPVTEPAGTLVELPAQASPLHWEAHAMEQVTTQGHHEQQEDSDGTPWKVIFPLSMRKF
jgi:hypothetical protein